MSFPSLHKSLTALIGSVTLLSLAAGCAPTLHPAADATPAPGGGATATSGGISIVTMTPDFPGSVDIEQALTPVKVRIRNTGKATALVRYSEFTLMASDGTVYPALPLYKIDGSVSEPLSYDPIIEPGFRWRRFRVASYYGGLYPGIPSFGGPYAWGRYGWPYYDDAFGPGFANVKLPTPAMYRNVLPEGVLDPGGELEGWLYFKKVKPQQGTIVFNAAITDVQGGALGKISIPYIFAK